MKIKYSIKQTDNLVLKYLSEIKDPLLREKAIKYHLAYLYKEKDSYQSYLESIQQPSIVNSLRNAISWGFPWSETEEGQGFWVKFNN